MENLNDIIFRKVLTYTISETENDSYNYDTALINMGLDSIKMIKFMLDLENTFAIKFPVNMINMSTFHSTQSISKALQSLLVQE